ncbi:ABC transporter permease [Paludibaculum fermentans]|uniref:ABC transporter permease n=1 Tax=Paludibaculum fermentans TaxID=1473598 RepID=A0A7S7NW61_PALFE|nr:ABC transporter permease [Paludibaculum fermentans]QOY90898.1 ABC transporter permease [Paludibaculum fermentans]
MALLQDFHLAARMLARNRVWALVAILALSLGVGANVAIFSVVGLMISVPLPYPHVSELAGVPQTNAARGFRQASVSLQDIADWRAAAGIASLAAYTSRPVAYSGEGEPQHLPAMQVTPDFFPTLGVAPAMGRAFTPSEGPTTEARVAVISYALWQGLFRGASDVLGRDLRLNGRNYTVIGVMPATFHFLYRQSDLWLPLALEPAQRTRGARGLNAIARLHPGVSPAQADAQVRAISERIAKEDPQNGEQWRGSVRPLSDRVIPKAARASAGAMFGAVGFVLLIACANVASLQLARGTQRHRELALRAALGASRGTLVRLQLVESLLVSLLAGAVGVLTSYCTVPLLKRIAPPEMQIFELAHVDLSALAFGLTLSVGCAVVFGFLPALLLTRGNLAGSLQDAGRGSSSGRHIVLNSLVVAEMALALVLVTASTMMIRSLIRQQSLTPGFDTRNLTVAYILLPQTRYATGPQVVDFYDRALQNLRRDAQVESAALVQTLPLTGDNSYLSVKVEGTREQDRDQAAGSMIVSPGYFRTLKIPLLSGRDFSPQDDSSARRVVIVNETFARRYWPGDPNPLGRRLRIAHDNEPWLTVIGLARDVRHEGIDDPPRPEIYRPHAQAAERIMTLVARSRQAGQSAAGSMRAAVWQLDREQPLFRLQTMEQLLLTRTSGQRATTKVLFGLAIIALILAAVGTYGVMAYTAARRIREIGIRLALGATHRSVFRMVLQGGARQAGIGLLVGLPAAYAVTPLLRAASDGLEPQDPRVYLAVALLLFAVALTASLAPARRAMRVDPATVLRSE